LFTRRLTTRALDTGYCAAGYMQVSLLEFGPNVVMRFIDQDDKIGRTPRFCVTYTTNRQSVSLHVGNTYYKYLHNKII